MPNILVPQGSPTSYDSLSQMAAGATVGYPETQFSAANFFGPTPPRQLGNGVALNAQGTDDIAPGVIQWHAVFLLAAIVAVGYLLWHHYGLGKE